MVAPARAKTKTEQRREELREQLWPNSGDRVWQGVREVGYWPAPRVLPLILHLTKHKKIVGTADCSFVYLELLSRDYGQGIVEIRDEDEHAFSAGYTGERARRTWQERLKILRDRGFLEVAPKGNKSFGFVLIVHPHRFTARFRRAGLISDRWWNLFQQQLIDSGLSPLQDPAGGEATG